MHILSDNLRMDEIGRDFVQNGDGRQISNMGFANDLCIFRPSKLGIGHLDISFFSPIMKGQSVFMNILDIK